RHGITLAGGTAYVTNMPCTHCAKALIAAGIVRVVIFSDYHDTLAERFFQEAGVELERHHIPDLTIHYDLAKYSSAVAAARRPCADSPEPSPPAER
ncbi:MAG TPA: deaminase, partial [Lentisphaeria bacterium]|nr:deaminase [Lentisphaeria bacterium]